MHGSRRNAVGYSYRSAGLSPATLPPVRLALQVTPESPSNFVGISVKCAGIRPRSPRPGTWDLVPRGRNPCKWVKRYLKHVWRARIILLSADGLGTMAIMAATGKSKTCVWRWQECFMEEGVDGLLRDKTRPPGRSGLRP